MTSTDFDPAATVELNVYVDQSVVVLVTHELPTDAPPRVIGICG
jgi:hypothetical protein